MVRIDRPQSPSVSAPEVRAPKMPDKAKRTESPAKRPVTAGGDMVTISSDRAPLRSPTSPSATPLGGGTNKPDEK